MNRQILVALTIVAMVGIMGAISIVPAFAAQKTIDESYTDVSNTTEKNVCGEDIVNVTREDSIRFTMWDNGKFKFQDRLTKTFYNQETGALISILFMVDNRQGDIDDLPLSVQFNTESVCLNTSEVFLDHNGVTVHKDGTTTTH